MSSFELSKIVMPTADYSQTANPFPRLKPLVSVVWPIQVGQTIPEEDRKYLNKDCRCNVLPYGLQEDYGRNRQPREFKTAVLENEFLRATFLMEFGGRLWSLYDKKNRKELLYTNSVFQPANLAFRNAWFSGGVEWNMGMPAHSPFTFDKPYFATLSYNDCTVLRMYEWERVRNAPYQVDFYLPADSKVLLVRCKLINPHDHDIAAYWYSNIAFPETKDTRIVVPAKKSTVLEVQQGVFGVEMKDFPLQEGSDKSYPVNTVNANDYFFRLPDNQKPWIYAADSSGYGLFQASTSALKGRKLFVWGMRDGSRHWQKFLSDSQSPYLEIQAGLGRTQYECLPFKANSSIEWLEAYGPLRTASDMRNQNYQQLYEEVGSELSQVVTSDWLEEELKASEIMSNSKPETIIQKGSRWGLLEMKAFNKTSASIDVGESLVFDIDNKQCCWNELIETGGIKDRDADYEPAGFVKGGIWKKLLTDAIEAKKADNWLGWYLLGVIECEAGEIQSAIKSWQNSISRKDNLWARRNLAEMYADDCDFETAAKMLEKAWTLSTKKYRTVAVEYARALLKCERFEQCEKFIKRLPKEIADYGRLQEVYARLLLEKRDFASLEKLFETIEIPDVRECEVVLTDIWFQMKAVQLAESSGAQLDEKLVEQVRTQMVPPERIDFRMS